MEFASEHVPAPSRINRETPWIVLAGGKKTIFPEPEQSTFKMEVEMVYEGKAISIL
jgi:hypothetical protein